MPYFYGDGIRISARWGVAIDDGYPIHLEKRRGRPACITLGDRFLKNPLPPGIERFWPARGPGTR
jgi:hypothetical protein